MTALRAEQRGGGPSKGRRKVLAAKAAKIGRRLSKSERSEVRESAKQTTVARSALMRRRNREDQIAGIYAGREIV